MQRIKSNVRFIRLNNFLMAPSRSRLDLLTFLFIYFDRLGSVLFENLDYEHEKEGEIHAQR